MASTEMSLEDIIRKKRIPPARRGRGGFRGGLTRPQFKQIGIKVQDRNVVDIRGAFGGSRGKVAVVGDARNRIILKNRTKITDARDKLAEMAKQRDARVKLETLKMKKGLIGAQIMNQKGKPRIPRGFTDMTRQVRPSPIPPPHHHPQHRGGGVDMNIISGYSMDIDMEDEYMPPPMKIVRSVNNNLSRYLPPPPDFPPPPSLPPKRPLRDKQVISNRQAGFNLTVVAKNSDVRKTSTMESSKRSHRLDRPRSPPIYVRERSPQPISILKKRPSMSQSLRASAIPSSSSSSSGYRILVSNLQNSVTASDIHELFGDIGELLDSRLVRPGTAEVIYSRLEDAQKAVDVYHNRQLDGQPMNCFLVNPRNPQTSSSSRPNTTSKSSSRAGAGLPASSNSSVVPDVSTFYKVLFGKD